MKVSVEHGINRVSSLDTLSYFSLIDIMHDLYEGVVPHEMKLLVNHCNSEAYFDLDTLNFRLEAFDFG